MSNETNNRYRFCCPDTPVTGVSVNGFCSDTPVTAVPHLPGRSSFRPDICQIKVSQFGPPDWVPNLGGLAPPARLGLAIRFSTTYAPSEVRSL